MKNKVNGENKFFFLAFMGNPDKLVIVDKRLVHVRANTAAMKVLGKKKLESLFLQDDWKEIKGLLFDFAGMPRKTENLGIFKLILGRRERWHKIDAVKLNAGGRVLLMLRMHDIHEHVLCCEKMEARLKSLEKFRKLAVGRELKMIELKKKIAFLKASMPGGK